MHQDYSISDELSCFSDAHEQFEEILKQLSSPLMATAEHGEVEQYIHEQGQELMRRVLQGHLQNLAEKEQERESVTVTRIRQRTQRQLHTRFGKVVVTRKSYETSEATAQFPLDGQLNLAGDRYSDGLRQLVAAQAALTSYDNTVELLQTHCAGTVPKRQARQVMANMAQDFEQFYQQREIQAEDTEELLILTFDGKGVVMRKNGLRECTLRNAERASHKLQTRLSAGEKKDRKRMAQVAAVYSVKAHIRQPEEIIRLPDQEQDRVAPQRFPARNKRVWASLKHSLEEVIAEAFDEAIKRDPQQKRRWVILIDGNRQQRKAIYKELGRRKLNATVVMDFIHVLEYLWKAAWELFERADPAVESWVAERALKLLNGQCGQVVKGLRSSATKRGLQASHRKNIDRCADYLYNNRGRLAYHTALSNGFPIASGVIEGACRHLVNDRLDITGARWGLEGAEAVLKIRAIRSSHDWDAYWRFHKQQSKERLYGDLAA